jgi:hypothetical protein
MYNREHKREINVWQEYDNTILWEWRKAKEAERKLRSGFPKMMLILQESVEKENYNSSNLKKDWKIII